MLCVLKYVTCMPDMKINVGMHSDILLHCSVCVFSACCHLGLALFEWVEGIFPPGITCCLLQALCVCSSRWGRCGTGCWAWPCTGTTPAFDPWNVPVPSVQLWCGGYFRATNDGCRTPVLSEAFHREFFPQFCFKAISNPYIIRSG